LHPSAKQNQELSSSGGVTVAASAESERATNTRGERVGRVLSKEDEKESKRRIGESEKMRKRVSSWKGAGSRREAGEEM
jgi:hypothetical protein